MATEKISTPSIAIGDFYTDEFGNKYEKWGIGWRNLKTGKIVTKPEQTNIEKQAIAQKIANPFKSIRNAKAIDPNAGYNSYSWMQSQVKRLGSLGRNPAQLMGSNVKFTRKISMGSMYLFNYNAKHKDTLPFWDMFPLVIPFSPANGGFLGLNIHYLPYSLRVALLEKLFDFSTSDSLNAETKMLFSWGMVSSAARYRGVESCVKHYLLNHVNSNFMYVDPRDWYTAAMMPLDRFVGAGKGTVWKNSMRQR